MNSKDTQDTEKRLKTLIYSSSKGKGSSNRQGSEIGRIPSMILTTIPKRQPTLFDAEEVIARDEALAKMDNVLGFMDSRRYDYSETQTLFALGYLCSNAEGEDIMQFVDETEKANIASSKYVTRRILLKDLCHFIFKDRKAVHVQSILKDILSLGSIPVKWIYETEDYAGRKEKRMKIAPILLYDIDIPIVDGRKLSRDEVAAQIVERGYIDVTFGRPFFQGIKKRFGYVTRNIITDWGSRGTRTEVFVRLSPILINMQWQFKVAAKKARAAAIKEAQKEKLPKDQREAMIAERERAALTRDFNLSTINNMVDYDFFGNRQYGLLKNQTQAVIDFYKERGLLLDGYFTGKGRDMKVYFVYNPDFGKNLLPEAEEEDKTEQEENP